MCHANSWSPSNIPRPLDGGGLGWGWGNGPDLQAGGTPLPNPPPQGGRGRLGSAGP
jgi:hypothetical protein